MLACFSRFLPAGSNPRKSMEVNLKLEEEVVVEACEYRLINRGGVEEGVAETLLNIG